MTIQPALLLELCSKWKLIGDYQFIFINSTKDAVYGPFGLLVFNANDVNERFIGNQLNVELHYLHSRQWAWYIKYAPFFNGSFLNRAKAQKRMVFFRTYLTYYF